jgi:hypothetical protein
MLHVPGLRWCARVAALDTSSTAVVLGLNMAEKGNRAVNSIAQRNA